MTIEYSLANCNIIKNESEIKIIKQDKSTLYCLVSYICDSTILKYSPHKTLC